MSFGYYILKNHFGDIIEVIINIYIIFIFDISSYIIQMSVYIIIVICGHIPENCLIIVVNGITAVTAIPELWIVRVHSVNHMG